DRSTHPKLKAIEKGSLSKLAQDHTTPKPKNETSGRKRSESTFANSFEKNKENKSDSTSSEIRGRTRSESVLSNATDGSKQKAVGSSTSTLFKKAERRKMPFVSRIEEETQADIDKEDKEMNSSSPKRGNNLT